MIRLALIGLVLCFLSACADKRRCEVDRNCFGGELCVAGQCEFIATVGDAGAGSYCDAGLTCAPYERCSPTALGGKCDIADVRVTWVWPSDGLSRGPVNAGFNAVVFVDAGSATTLPLSVPVVQEDGGLMTNLLPAGGNQYAGNVTLNGPEGTKVLIAGWPASPATGQSARLTVGWDERPPLLTASFRTGPFLRDDLVHLTITANEPLDPVSVNVMLGGESMGVDGADCDGGCWLLDMSRPVLDALNGNFTLVVSAADVVGNLRTVDAGTLSVSRMRWEVQVASGEVHAAPTVGSDGTLYIGGGSNTNSSLYAVDWADGGTLRSTPLGLTLSLAVAESNGAEHLYFSARDDVGGKVGSMLSSNFVLAAHEPQRGNAGGPTNTAVALFALSAVEVGAVGSFNAIGTAPSSVVFYSPVFGPRSFSAPDGGPTFSYLLVPPGERRATNIIVNAGEAWLPTRPAEATDGMYWTSVGNFSAAPTLVQQRQLEVPGNDCCLAGQAFANGAALVSGSLAARRVHSVNSNMHQTGNLGSASDKGLAAVVDSSTAFVGDATELVRFNPSSLGAPPVQLASGPNVVVRTSPVLGKAGPRQTVGMGYAVTESGGLWAFRLDANSAVLWGDVFLGSDFVYGHPNLDCNRRTGAATTTTGILYLASSWGRVAAIIVDSPKLLDSPGAWPRFQRTAANAGNTDNARFAFNPGCP